LKNIGFSNQFSIHDTALA